MVKFFTVEYESAISLAEELEAIPPKKDSNEARLLNLLKSYITELSRFGILMRNHHEKRKVDPADILHNLKAIYRAEEPLVSMIPGLLFKKFDVQFLNRRREEDLKGRVDPSEANQIWFRGMQLRGAIDFLELFKDEIEWTPSASDRQNGAAQFFAWLEDNLHQANRLIDHPGETAFDWVRETKSLNSESPTTSPRTESECSLDLDQKPEKQSLWSKWYRDFCTTTFKEFRENLGPTLMR
jgi:hypothetical protein